MGDKAPDFTLTARSGEKVSLKDFVGKKDIVLYFYPKDFTPGCTQEACTFRDSYEEFRDEGAEVIGISSDTKDSHSMFALHYKLPFILLSDEDGAVRKLYGVPKTFGMLPGRTTYLIDVNGVVRYIFSSQFMPGRHRDEALKALRNIHREFKKAV
ncbi:MAG: peroxiredoxin [Deltaproteobacteria bacterium]|nr:peroxiredoxin [Deltaproteobacteria bacterium]MCL5278076.1 peroxiredoxin [Deltaproteobacteria bacterium]